MSKFTCQVNVFVDGACKFIRFTRIGELNAESMFNQGSNESQRTWSLATS